MAKVGGRALRLAGLLLLLVAAALLLLRRAEGSRPFEALSDPGRAGRIELAQLRAQLVLHRRRDTGTWEIASAEDAPADAARIARLLEGLAGLDAGAPVAPPSAEPMRLRVSDREGATLAEAELWPGVVRPLPQGRAFRAKLPLPPLDPARWSTLRSPRLPPIRAVHKVAASGSTPLPAAEATALASSLDRLSAENWVPARQLNWAGAAYYQIETEAGLVEAQVMQTAEGRFVRLTSERLPDIRRLRAFAFRLDRAG